MQKVVTIILSLVFLVACKDRNAGNKTKIDNSRIYFNYRISGEEDKEYVTCLLQFHNKGPQGATLELEKPGMVKLDGEEISADSTVMTGAYYEVQKPAESFVGKHTITFIDLNKKQYTEEFSFTPFSLQPELPRKVRRQDIQLGVEGLAASDSLELVLTDTAFATDDVQITLPVNDGVILIPRQQLQQVRSGPVHLYLYKEENRSVREGTKAGGRIAISYGLRREFNLVD